MTLLYIMYDIIIVCMQIMIQQIYNHSDVSHSKSISNDKTWWILSFSFELCICVPGRVAYKIWYNNKLILHD